MANIKNQKNYNVSLEECIAEYFDESKLKKPVTTLYRMNNHDAGRYYYGFNQIGDPIFFISVTTLIKQTMPTSPFLLKWIADMGYEEAQKYTAERAGYGTFMHIQFVKLLKERKLNLDEIDAELEQYMAINYYPIELFLKWKDDIKRDCLALAQFIKDCNVKPLFIEQVLASAENGYAGAVDLCCEMEIEVSGFFGEVYKTGDRKGQPKETKGVKKFIAVVDFKSGRKNFYEDNEIQLAAYKQLTEENFGIKVDKVFNFSPKEWTKNPSYNLKDQTDSPNAEKLPLLTKLAAIEKQKKDMSLTIIGGVLDLDSEKSIFENCQSYQLDEYVKIRREDRLKELENEAAGIALDEVNLNQNTKDEQE